MSLYYQGIAQHTDGRQVAVSGQPPRLFATRKEQGATSAHELSALYYGTKLIWSNWLSDAAQQAILAAFGQTKGWEVIAATNAYLDTIALTDEPRFKALAQFVDEDPMMVCSIVETGVVRKLVSDGLSWIMTGVNASLTAGFELDFELLSLSNNNCNINSVDYASGNRAFGIGFWNKNWVYQYGGYNHQDTVQMGVVYHYRQKGGSFLLEDNAGFYRTLTRTASSVIDTEMPFPGGRRNNGGVNYSAILKTSMLKMYEGNTTLKHFIPLVSATRDGMVDLITGTFHPNQGTGHFTDAYTLQDGITPWTPGTPIP